MNNIERFDKVFEKSKLYDENLVAINRIDPRSFISGTNLYSNGKHSIHFRLEKVYKAGKFNYLNNINRRILT